MVHESDRPRPQLSGHGHQSRGGLDGPRFTGSRPLSRLRSDDQPALRRAGHGIQQSLRGLPGLLVDVPRLRTRPRSPWVEDWGLEGRTLLEIGAGRGDFSRLLASAGAARVVAMDPTLDAERFGEPDQRVTLLPRRSTHSPTCRVWTPSRCAMSSSTSTTPAPSCGTCADAGRPPRRAGARRAAGGRAHPGRGRVLGHLPRALQLPDSRGGHRALRVKRVRRRVGHARLRRPVPPHRGPARRPPSLDAAPARGRGAPRGGGRAVPGRVARQVESLGRTIAHHARSGRVVLWGSGSKGTAFLHALGPGAAEVDAVIDVNPHLSGKYVAGTGHPILAPGTLGHDPADLVVVMNPVYAAEIRAELDRLSPRAALVALGTSVDAMRWPLARRGRTSPGSHAARVAPSDRQRDDDLHPGHMGTYRPL